MSRDRFQNQVCLRCGCGVGVRLGCNPEAAAAVARELIRMEGSRCGVCGMLRHAVHYGGDGSPRILASGATSDAAHDAEVRIDVAREGIEVRQEAAHDAETEALRNELAQQSGRLAGIK